MSCVSCLIEIYCYYSILPRKMSSNEKLIVELIFSGIILNLISYIRIERFKKDLEKILFMKQ